MKPWIPLVTLAALTHPAAADSIGAEPADYGRVTAIHKGVKELDVGGIFVLSHERAGDAPATTRISSLGSLGFQYFLKDNVSVGGSFLASYDRQSEAAYATAFGGMAFASLHVRLGLGAFLRPTFGAGVLVGDQKLEATPGVIMRSSQVALLTRISLPFAYFPSRRIVLQAGPELDVSLGQITPEGGTGASFTTVTGGFGVGAGYAF